MLTSVSSTFHMASHFEHRSDTLFEEQWRESMLSLVKDVLIQSKSDDQSADEIAKNLYDIAMSWPEHPEALSLIKEGLSTYFLLFGENDTQETAQHLLKLSDVDSKLGNMILPWSVMVAEKASEDTPKSEILRIFDAKQTPHLLM